MDAGVICLTSRSIISTGSSTKLSLSSSRSSFIGMTRDSSDKHFFRLETWKVLWILLSSSGSSSLYATGPIRSRILKGNRYTRKGHFIAIGSAEDERQIKEMNEESKDPEKKRLKKRVVNKTPREEDTTKAPAEQEVTEQGTKKRKSGLMKMIARKRPRPQPDDDSDDEHKQCIRIVTFEGTIDSEIMETKSFIAKLHKVSSPDRNYIVIYRVNGHFKAFNYLMEVLHIFDRQDLFHLYDLVMKQYSEITPEDIELILWGDLKIMIVCIQELKDGTVIYMLVERRYSLSKELLQQMLDLGLEVEEERTAALQLERFIKQYLNEE
ncbi:hypothetical protein Tco_0978720 [Tanacetum coccineum]|uniref:Uncharacterized protein n=1 Tax=Tanacetum coccineum TaxID=301880 RepID=A0ABQ5ENP1_9ASTR